MTRRASAWAWLALLSLVMGLSACRRDEPERVTTAAGDPVAAVEGLADALRDDDLVRWSKLSLPPELHARHEAAWVRRQQLAEPPTPEDAAEYAKVMARLTAPDAEEALVRDLEPKLRQFEGEVAGQWPLMQATLSIFVDAAIEANTDLSAAQKTHGTELADNLMQWLQPALLTDRDRARRAIAVMTRTAREIDVPTLEQARALPLQPALEKGGVALRGVKDVAKIYGLDLDRTLDGVEAELVESAGDQATVRVTYPLLDREHAFELEMVRRDGGWYSAQAIADAEADLEALAEEEAAAGDSGTTDAGAGPAEPAATGTADDATDATAGAAAATDIGG